MPEKESDEVFEADARRQLKKYEPETEEKREKRQAQNREDTWPARRIEEGQRHKLLTELSKKGKMEITLTFARGRGTTTGILESYDGRYHTLKIRTGNKIQMINLSMIGVFSYEEEPNGHE